MNTNLVSIVKGIAAGYGEAVLADPQRFKAFFSDLAKEEPKPLRIAFGRCIEAGAYTALKTASDRSERGERKTAIAQRVRDEHGLDVALCGEALDILEAALYGTAQTTPPPGAVLAANSAPAVSSAKKKPPIAALIVVAAVVAMVLIGFFYEQSASNNQQSASNSMVFIQGGTFTMGSPPSEAGRDSDEDQHSVTMSSFYMSKYEVTVGDFRRFVNATGYKTTAETSGGGLVLSGGKLVQKSDASWQNPYFSQNDNHPVVLVSWYDAVEYCNWRSQQEGLSPAYIIDKSRKDPNNRNIEQESRWEDGKWVAIGDTLKWTVRWNPSAKGYRLPTEAEWEYACRAGTTTRYWSGNDETSLGGKANVADQTSKEKYNWASIVNIRDGYTETAPVGSFSPNPWGLYDMHGNVWEWCWDWYGSYTSGIQTNPEGPYAGAGRVLRGGSGWAAAGRAPWLSAGAPKFVAVQA
jgi:formylglycine-generating enzyme required for sulfatase activity